MDKSAGPSSAGPSSTSAPSSGSGKPSKNPTVEDDTGSDHSGNEEEEDEEDLDDLDDVLPTFNKPPPQASAPAPAASASTANPRSSNVDPPSVSSSGVNTPGRVNLVGGDNIPGALDGVDDPKAFEEELMRGMQELLAGLGGPASGAKATDNFPAPQLPNQASSGNVSSEERELQDLFARLLSGGEAGKGSSSSASANVEDQKRDFEALMKELMDYDQQQAGSSNGVPHAGTTTNSTPASNATGSSSSAQAPNPALPSKPKTFDDTIRQSLRNLSQPPPTQGSSSADDPLAALLEQFAAGAGGEGGMDGYNEAEFGKVFDGMMKQLMTRDILEEPLQELAEKYPPFLSANSDKLLADKKKAYTRQSEIVKEILSIFARKDYSDENSVMTTKVTSLMTEMQDLGSPPEEIMGEMPEGFDFAGQEGCSIM